MLVSLLRQGIVLIPMLFITNHFFCVMGNVSAHMASDIIAMAAAAVQYQDKPIRKEIVLTKYDHVMGNIPGAACYKADIPYRIKTAFKERRRSLIYPRIFRHQTRPIPALQRRQRAVREAAGATGGAAGHPKRRPRQQM